MKLTPKEKAKELIDKYMFMEVPNYVSKFEIKLCAIIAVNEILEAINDYTIEPIIFDIEYYEEVKQEIEIYE